MSTTATSTTVATTAHESFLKRFETAFCDLFHKSPTYLHVAILTVQYAAPVLEAILGAVDPAVEVLVAPIVARIEADLASAYVLASEGTSSSATLATTMTALQSQMTQLESVAGIKDADTQAKIATVLSEIQAVISAIPTPGNDIAIQQAKTNLGGLSGFAQNANQAPTSNA